MYRRESEWSHDFGQPGLTGTMSERRMSLRRGRTLAAWVMAGTIGWVCAFVWAAPSAGAAHTLNVTDTAHLHLVATSGQLLIEEGSALGALPGNLKGRFRVTTTVSASATLYLRGGSIRFHGLGVPGSVSGFDVSFAGRMSVDGGSGCYVHARGSGGFYGVVNRRTWAVTVQMTGKLSY
jgi:hypothetical protein